MKNILFTLCIAAAISAHAQVEVDFGVKAGANFSHQNIANSGLAFLPKNRTSFNGGVYFHAKKGRFGILSEVAYSMQGGNYNYPEVNYVGGFHVDYFTMPLLFTYSIKKVTLQLGPQLSVLNMAKQKVNGETSDVKYLYKTGDFGIAGGLTVSLPRGFQIGARYVAGTRNINNSNMANIVVTNGLLQVYASYKLASFKISKP